MVAGVFGFSCRVRGLAGGSGAPSEFNMMCKFGNSMMRASGRSCGLVGARSMDGLTSVFVSGNCGMSPFRRGGNRVVNLGVGCRGGGPAGMKSGGCKTVVAVPGGNKNDNCLSVRRAELMYAGNLSEATGMNSAGIGVPRMLGCPTCLGVVRSTVVTFRSVVIGVRTVSAELGGRGVSSLATECRLGG